MTKIKCAKTVVMLAIANTTAQSNVISLLMSFAASAVAQVTWLAIAPLTNAIPISLLVWNLHHLL